MRVAVCDNEQSSIDDIVMKLKGIDMVNQIDSFVDLRQFFSLIRTGKQYDVIFMDIDWGTQKDGVDYISAIRGMKFVFFTSYPLKYAERIFMGRGTPSGYLLKPVESEALECLLVKIRNELHQEKRTLDIICGGKQNAIVISQIEFVEGVLHKTHFHLETGQVVDYNRSLSEVMNMLPDYFIQSHKSYLVNPEKIATFSAKKIVLHSNREIPVSRSKGEEARRNFFNYLGQGVIGE